MFRPYIWFTQPRERNQQAEPTKNEFGWDCMLGKLCRLAKRCRPLATTVAWRRSAATNSPRVLRGGLVNCTLGAVGKWVSLQRNNMPIVMMHDGNNRAVMNGKTGRRSGFPA
jgi:hypothetical protein